MTDTSLKRFDPYSEHAGDELGQMQENDYGDYYNREDVDAKLAEHAAEIERLRDALINERERCAAIADKWAIHEQRVHGNGGPAAEIRRGTS